MAIPTGQVLRLNEVVSRCSNDRMMLVMLRATDLDTACRFLITVAGLQDPMRNAMKHVKVHQEILTSSCTNSTIGEFGVGKHMRKGTKEKGR